MGGMKFEFDENGGKFYYFFLSFYALILLPTTYWLWPKPEKKKNATHPEDTTNFEASREKYQLLQAKEPNQKRRAIITKIGFIIAWIILIILAYRVSLIETEHKEYDPFAVLNVDRESSVSDIKRAYRELSKVYHPDRGGDAEKFKEIAKAYKTLTDEEAKENWKNYGNPDGPGVTHFGIALPVWLVDHQNSIFVLFIYTGIFMIVLPVFVCIWYHQSVRYPGDLILNETIQIYYALFSRASTFSIKRAVLILSLSKEYERAKNPVIIERSSDNIELPKLMRQFDDLKEKAKGPFQAPYTVKARLLIHAHLRRYDGLSDDLKKDQQYIIKRSTYLINQMVSVEGQLVALKDTENIKYPPRLETVETTMKLSVMIVQALMNPKSPLLQLPHITESHLKYFTSKKRVVKSIQQFAAMDDEDRRYTLRSLTDEQYHDIMSVIAIYPHITMKVSCEVFDDENQQEITTGAVVTLDVHLHRENMSSLFSKQINGNINDNDINDEQIAEQENQEKINESTKSTSSKGWTNKADKKKKSNKDKGKKKGQPTSSKSNKQPLTTTATTTNKPPTKIENKDSSDDDSSNDSPDLPKQTKEDLNESENEDENIEQTQSIVTNDAEEDTFIEKFQQQQRKREILETKEKISHQVFCPFYPEIKQECWWLYVADEKKSLLINIPIYLCTLKDDEEIQVKFLAPKNPGHHDYSVHLKSDSYFGVDIKKDLPLDVVKADKVIADHPQWKFSDDEDETNNKDKDNDFATESESDNE